MSSFLILARLRDLRAGVGTRGKNEKSCDKEGEPGVDVSHADAEKLPLDLITWNHFDLVKRCEQIGAEGLRRRGAGGRDFP